MKKPLITLCIAASFAFVSTPVTAQTPPVQAPAQMSAAPAAAAPTTPAQMLDTAHSTAELDSGAFWIRRWSQKDPAYTGINLKTVTNYDSALLMTFSGADYSYLNQQAASSFKQTSPGTYVWSYQDSKIDYSRTYEVRGDEVVVHVLAKFLGKAPDKAYLNLVAQGLADDPEEKDREVFYYTNSSIERHKTHDEIKPTEIATPIKWVGMGSRYFILVVLPDGVQSEKLLLQSTGPKAAQASLQFPVTNQMLDAKFRIAFVPKKLDTLRAIDPTLDTTVNLGFFTFLAYPILWTLKFIYKFVGNYGVAIIILTLLVKLLTFPLVVKSMKSMKKMSEFQPKMKALQERYKDDKETFNREMMLMMKTSGYNPMAGCFPMLLQMPIFFALYSVLYAAVELYHAPFFGWLNDLSARDHFFVTPVLMTLVMFLQQKLTPPAPGMDPTQQKVMQFMPLMFGAFMLTTPSGLCVYMLVNAIFSVVQQRYLNKKLGVGAYAAQMSSGF